MLMILARLGCPESFWAAVKLRSPHTGPEVCYIIDWLANELAGRGKFDVRHAATAWSCT